MLFFKIMKYLQEKECLGVPSPQYGRRTWIGGSAKETRNKIGHELSIVEVRNRYIVSIQYVVFHDTIILFCFCFTCLIMETGRN